MSNHIDGWEPSDGFNKDKWVAYLTVQKSGLTNMWDGNAVEEIAWDLCDVDLYPEDSLYVIENYDKLVEYYGFGMDGV